MTSGVYERTPEGRANLSAAMAGRLGELSNAWKGDGIGYVASHYRARKALANQPCAHADETCSGQLESALRHDTQEEAIKTNPATGSPYSTHAGDYVCLCWSHHRRYDFGGA